MYIIHKARIEWLLDNNKKKIKTYGRIIYKLEWDPESIHIGVIQHG